jgi:5-methylcytosine-specific restriction endonuclease McrA
MSPVAMANDKKSGSPTTDNAGTDNAGTDNAGTDNAGTDSADGWCGLSVSPDAGLCERLDAATGLVSTLVAELDPDCLDGPAAKMFYESLVGIERLVTAGKTLLAPRIDASGVWRDGGHRNAAEMLGLLEGISTGAARNTLVNGERLGQLPGTEAALRAGELSAPKVTELTGAGILSPERESELLAGATDDSLGVIRQRCRRSRATAASADPMATTRKIRAARHFSSWTDEEGAFCYRGRDTAERGARILASLAETATRLRKSRRTESPQSESRPSDLRRTEDGHSAEPEAAVRADAFFALVTRHHPDTGVSLVRKRGAPPGPRVGSTDPDLDAGEPTGIEHDTDIDPGYDADSGYDADLDHEGEADRGIIDAGSVAEGEPGDPDGRDGPSEDSLSIIDGPATCTVMIRVDLDALQRGCAEEGELCEIDNQGPIPVALAQVLSNDSYLRLVFHRAGRIEAISHFNRTINRRLRTALVYRDTTCVVPGCSVSTGLEIDHVVPWALGGPTELDNLALLCHHHHQKKTYEDWVLSRKGFDRNGSPIWRFEAPPPFGQEPGLGLDTPAAREEWNRLHGLDRELE